VSDGSAHTVRSCRTVRYRGGGFVARDLERPDSVRVRERIHHPHETGERKREEDFPARSGGLPAPVTGPPPTTSAATRGGSHQTSPPGFPSHCPTPLPVPTSMCGAVAVHATTSTACVRYDLHRATSDTVLCPVDRVVRCVVLSGASRAAASSSLTRAGPTIRNWMVGPIAASYGERDVRASPRNRGVPRRYR